MSTGPNSRTAWRPVARTGSARSLTGALIAIGLHAAVLFALLQLDPVRSAITAALPITGSLITPPQPVVKPDVPPKPLPPKPRVQRPRPVPKPPVMTAAPEAPTEYVAPPAPLPPIEVAPPPVAAAPAPAPVVVPPAPPPLTPPSFNAAYLNNPAPAYQSLSRRMGEEGRVVLRVFVSEDGRAAQVQLKTSSKHPRLDEAALEAVRRWRFVPARRGDTAVSAWVLVPISFSLRS
jgi:protein TonB